MRRVFWLGIGLAVGVVVVRRLTRTAQAYTPSGVAASLQESAVGVLDSVRTFVEDVRDGMAEKEAEIHAAFAAGELLDEGFTDDDADEDDFGPQTWHEQRSHQEQPHQEQPQQERWHQEGGYPR